jgi:hypothetical protein
VRELKSDFITSEKKADNSNYILCLPGAIQPSVPVNPEALEIEV